MEYLIIKVFRQWTTYDLFQCLFEKITDKQERALNSVISMVFSSTFLLLLVIYIKFYTKIYMISNAY